MDDFSILSGKQIKGDDRLKLLDVICETTDFSTLLGGKTEMCTTDIMRREVLFPSGMWWTQTPTKTDYTGNRDVVIVDFSGSLFKEALNYRGCGTRPVIAYSKISASCKNVVINEKEIIEVEYGEYPQMVADEALSYELEMLYNIRRLKFTGRKYTTDSDSTSVFRARFHTEYEYRGNRYIRFVCDSNCDKEPLSDGRITIAGDAYWLKVEPIIWLVDEYKDIAITKKIIFAGVPFKSFGSYTGDFASTTLYWFMNTFFKNEIVYNYSNSKRGTGDMMRQNPYNLNFDSVTEEDIIRGAIESNISVFLHGRSSEGKSSRVKQLDPDCKIIYLNLETPESFNGKSVYNSLTGEMLDMPPTWYLKVKEKCESEPDKIHIVFFDELTNALPSIQSMAFNVVLDGEIKGKWKLPSNARIVAAGNDMDDSIIANQMPKALFNRFAHVYIYTTVDSWLEWASTPKEKYERLDYVENQFPSKIHPAIYAYIAYSKSIGHDVLRTPYTGDKPNADPRKWEMASKMLFKTRQPEMLRSLIGYELAAEFTAFVRQQVISVDDVVNNRYDDEDLEMGISQKFLTAALLSSVDDDNFEVVRDFMKEVGEEPRAIFETMWAAGNEQRLNKIEELKRSDRCFQKVKTR